jgi:hypothetical protein
MKGGKINNFLYLYQNVTILGRPVKRLLYTRAEVFWKLNWLRVGTNESSEPLRRGWKGHLPRDGVRRAHRSFRSSGVCSQGSQVYRDLLSLCQKDCDRIFGPLERVRFGETLVLWFYCRFIEEIQFPENIRYRVFYSFSSLPLVFPLSDKSVFYLWMIVFIYRI